MKIRARDRVLASPPEGKKQAWVEYQVIEGRRVLSRHDTPEQAERWIAEVRAGEK